MFKIEYADLKKQFPCCAMPKVIVRKSTYEYSVLKPVIFEVMDALGGRKIGNGSKVLVKPNFLAPARPEEAVLTHPLVIKAVAEYILERGGKPTVADSPAVGSFYGILKHNGVTEALRGLDVKCSPFRHCIHRDIGPPFGKIEIAGELLDADFLINLPKLKTHESMMLTLGVKNLFGCIVGLRKPNWHFRTGIDRDYFARLLVQIHNAVRPFMTVLDAVTALEGEGPGKTGKPRQLGLILGCEDAIALDRAVCDMVGLNPVKLYTHKAAMRMGLSGAPPEIDGELPRIENFRMPKIIPPTFGPKSLQKVIRKYFIRKPAVRQSLCRFCGKCRSICPTRAITEKEGALDFNYDECIRCFCCLEVCPEGALKPTGLFAEKLVHAYLKVRRSQTGIPE